MKTHRFAFGLIPIGGDVELASTALLLVQQLGSDLMTAWATTDRMDTLAVLNACVVDDRLLDAMRRLSISDLPRESSEMSVQSDGVAGITTVLLCAQRCSAVLEGPDQWYIPVNYIIDLTAISPDILKRYTPDFQELEPDMTLVYVDEDGEPAVEIFYSRDQALAALADRSDWLGPGDQTHADRVEQVMTSTLPETCSRPSQLIFGLAANHIVASCLVAYEPDENSS